MSDSPLEDLGDLPAPEVIAREIVEDLTAALAEFEALAAALEASAAPDDEAELSGGHISDQNRLRAALRLESSPQQVA